MIGKFQFVDDDGKKVKTENDEPVFSKSDVREVVKNELSNWVEEVEGDKGEDFFVCPTCNIPYIFESGSGFCVICGAEYKNGKWSYSKQKKAKVEEVEGEVLVKSKKAIPEESEDLEEIDIGESGAPEFLELKRIGISKCDGCGKKVNWNDIEPYYGQVPFVSGIAKKCPECGKEVYWLDRDNKQWVLKAEFDNRDEEEEDLLDIV